MHSILSLSNCVRVSVVGICLPLLLFIWRGESSPPRIETSRSQSTAYSSPFDELQRASWQRANMRGAGIRIAVIDSGFRGYREQLGRVLPAHVRAKSFRIDGDIESRDSIHGILCAEVIHSIAPDAELIFVNWEPEDPESFRDAMRWCRKQGADIVSCSVVMPTWSDGEGGGQLHRDLASVFGDGDEADDTLAVACAGNLAQRHWGGRFSPNQNGYHRWKNQTIDNRVTPWGQDRVSIEFISSSKSEYELELFDVTQQQPVGVAIKNTDAEISTIVVRLEPQVGHTYSLRVRLKEGKPGRFHLFALSAWLELHKENGSIPFPGDGSEWLAIGAVGSDNRRACYSSCGPNSLRHKPELVAQVPVPTHCRTAQFSGTSAAAPQAAGLAALVWSRNRDWTANQVRKALIDSCHDLGPQGHDFETGFGRIRLPNYP